MNESSIIIFSLSNLSLNLSIGGMDERKTLNVYDKIIIQKSSIE